MSSKSLPGKVAWFEDPGCSTRALLAARRTDIFRPEEDDEAVVDDGGGFALAAAFGFTLVPSEGVARRSPPRTVRGASRGLTTQSRVSIHVRTSRVLSNDT